MLSDPVAITHILQKRIYDYRELCYYLVKDDVNCYIIDHSKVVRPRVARFLGKGLGWVEGESEHKRMKRLVAPSLSFVI